MAIAFTGNSTSYEDGTTSDAISPPIAFTVNVGDCVVVVVARTTQGFAIGTVTDDGAAGGNIYTVQVPLAPGGPFPWMSIFTCIATKPAANINCSWTAGSTSSVAIVSYSGVGSIGSHNSAGSSGGATTEIVTIGAGITAGNWAVAGLTHLYAGGPPTQQNGNKRVTSIATPSNCFTSINDGTGSSSITVSNTFGSSSTFSVVACELVPAATLQEMPDMTPGTCVMWRKT